MMRLGLVVLFSIVLAGPALAQPGPGHGEVRHSGTIVEITPDGSAIVLEELAVWSGPGTGVVSRSIRLTPDTSIRLVERAPGDGGRTAMPGWKATAVDALDLREGDFVTVTTHGDRRAVAVALQIVRPAGEGD